MRLSSQQSELGDNYGDEEELFKASSAVIVAPSNNKDKKAAITNSEKYTTALLLVINLANFADRFTVPSVLVAIGKAYHVSDQRQLGLLHTVFVVSFLVFSPLFGYLGDRFNRRLLMAIGLLGWASVSLASAFVPSSWPYAYWIFLTLRSLVGIGEASYATISLTIISDLFAGRRRTIAIFLYQSMMLVGSGIGYMMASAVTKLTGSWHFAFVVWPPVVYLCAVGLIFMKEPERGKAEGVSNLRVTSYREDLTYLMTMRSYLFNVFGTTCQSFVVGALSFWAPTFAEYQMKMNDPDRNVSFVGLIFGVITTVGGFCGAVVGTLGSRKLRQFKTIGKASDAVACSLGSLLSGPLIYVTLIISSYNTIGMWLMMFLSLTFLSVYLVVNQKILLYVLIPTRRATGAGLQILITHLLGDAISPYIVGLMIDAFQYTAVSDTIPARVPNNLEDFVFRQHALLITSCFCCLGAFFYFMCSLFVHQEKDSAKVLAASMSYNSLPSQTSISQISSTLRSSPVQVTGDVTAHPINN